ncbi:MAG TPA: DUF503 domain-containing protein [Miltoncostaeaceae bacterium]|jgi:uncharacterized protein|nr:DUF503 domain-containing protein [Miltoncostaeaceae bacterium]
MGAGYVGTVSVDLHLPAGGSLKDKRRELRRVKETMARRFGCAVAEVDHHDLWQRARITAAVVGRDAADVGGRVEALSRWLNGDEVFQVVGESREVIPVSDEPHLSLGED